MATHAEEQEHKSDHNAPDADADTDAEEVDAEVESKSPTTVQKLRAWGRHGALTPEQHSQLQQYLEGLPSLYTTLSTGDGDEQRFSVRLQSIPPSLPPPFSPTPKINSVPSEDELTALRFLRATNFSVKDALQMYGNHLLWRERHHITHASPNSLPINCPSKYALMEALCPHTFHGFDKDNRPIFYEHLGKIDVKSLLTFFTAEEYLEAHIYKMQMNMKRVDDTMREKKFLNEEFILILDCEGLSYETRHYTEFLTICSENDKANYPERLGLLCCINVPRAIRLLYKMFSPLIDKRTKQKIHLIGQTNVHSKLMDLLGIDETQLPNEYNGKCSLHGENAICLPKPDIANIDWKIWSGGRNGTRIQEAREDIEIRAGKQHQLSFTVPPEATIYWFLRCLSDDIELTIASEDGQSDAIVPQQRLSSHRNSWRHNGDTATTIAVTMSNAFSWWNSKRIHFLFIVVKEE